MGRKLHRKVITRPKPSLPKIYDCPKCEAKAIEVELNETNRTASVSCGNCHINRTFSEIKKIESEVDIYGNFLDQYYLEIESQSEKLETPTPVPKSPLPAASSVTDKLGEGNGGDTDEDDKIDEDLDEVPLEEYDDNG